MSKPISVKPISGEDRDAVEYYLQEFADGCCRIRTISSTADGLMTGENTSTPSTWELSELQFQQAAKMLKTEAKTLKQALKKQCNVLVSDSVFEAHKDEMWYLGGDVSVRYKKGAVAVSGEDGAVSKGDVVPDLGKIAISLIQQHMQALRDWMCPPNPDYVSSRAEWCGGEFTAYAARDLAVNSLVGNAHGYFMHMDDVSNERYNAGVGSTHGEITVDPTRGTEEVLWEFENCIVFRINEPFPGRKTNCKWKVRKNQCPQMYTSRDIKKGEELFIFYGEGFAPNRTYATEAGLEWDETSDSYNSD